MLDSLILVKGILVEELAFLAELRRKIPGQRERWDKQDLWTQNVAHPKRTRFLVVPYEAAPKDLGLSRESDAKATASREPNDWANRLGRAGCEFKETQDHPIKRRKPWAERRCLAQSKSLANDAVDKGLLFVWVLANGACSIVLPEWLLALGHVLEESIHVEVAKKAAVLVAPQKLLGGLATCARVDVAAVHEQRDYKGEFFEAPLVNDLLNAHGHTRRLVFRLPLSAPHLPHAHPGACALAFWGSGQGAPEEFEEIKKHSIIGATILHPIKELGYVAREVRHHQECYDGSGYPDGLKGKDIPLIARIISVADAFDAITTNRPYKKKKTVEEALFELKRCSGAQFDPVIVSAFLLAYEKGKILSNGTDQTKY